MSRIVTPKFRVSFPAVFQPKLNKLSNKTEFSLVALFKVGEDLSALQAAANQAVVDKWGPDQSKWPNPIRSPFRDQAEKAKTVDGKQVMPDGHEAGAIFMNLKSKNKPGVVDANVQPILDENEFYAGCWALCSINAYAYDQMGNRGVSFGLGNVQKVGEGEPFGSRTLPEQDFKPVEMEGNVGTNVQPGNAAGIF